MDDRRFDTLARTLARSTSRRTAVRALAGVAVGSLFGLRRREAAAASAQGLPLDLDLDLLVCVGLNPLLALRACIALNLPHVARAACEGGRCVIKACDPGWGDCDGQAATGCETPLGTLQHCGACGAACRVEPTPGSCEVEPICQAGACTFTPQPPGTVCREAAGICDVEEVCDGVSIDCPPDAFRGTDVECRSSAGPCDIAEFCTGTSVDCPNDAFRGADVECRAAIDVCDVAEFCTGTSAACPEDAFADETVECRVAAGPCDVAEFCTGTSAACPEDVLAGTNLECRTASCTNGVATLPATCTGLSASCPDAVTELCSPYLCGATACLETCPGPDNEGCIPSHHCDAGQCLSDEGLGAPCDEHSDCISGVCTAGGVCCNEACDGECVECTAATGGVCTPRTGQPCGAGATCLDGDTARTGGTCTAMGACQAGATVECAPYACQGDACLMTCAGDGDCVAAAHCDAPTCVPDVVPGGACNENSDCISGVCTAGGVCCNEPCEGECVTCTAATGGVCTPRTGQACGAEATCLDGDTAQLGGVCTAEGTCQAGGTVECAPYACQDGACLTTCADDSQCVASHFCSPQGVCVPDLPNGQMCDRPAMCASGNCNVVSDICCAESCPADVPCSGPGFTCGCTIDTDCPALQFCNASNQCQDDFPYAGGPCDRGAQCVTGVCNTTTGGCGCEDDGDCGAGQFCCGTTLTCDSLICTNLILSGGPSPTSAIGVDDDLFIDLIQGATTTPLIVDVTPALAESFAPVAFTANPGDQLHIVAIDTGGSAILSPIYLHCADSPCLQQVVHPGYRDDSGGSTGTFIDTTVTINVQPVP